MKTNKSHKYLVLLALIVMMPLFMWMAWLLTPVKPLNIAIIDKTVLTRQVREHASFNWILKNLRITKKDRSFYRPASDYFGLFPEREDQFDKNKNTYQKKGLELFSHAQIDSIAGTLDMAYYTDTYGLYYNEWKDIDILEHSPLIYGGMSAADIYLLAALKQKKKLIITEFNDVATPTNKEVRQLFATLFGVNWSGWAGRYFDILDTSRNAELPVWLKKGYVAQHGFKWPFKKAGIALVNEDGRVEILEKDTHLSHEYPVIVSSDTTANRFGVTDRMDYAYWFDINRSSFPNNIISRYILDTNAEGDAILKKNGIPKSFPAVIERKEDCNFYYFCGDFAENKVSDWLANLKYINRVKYTITISREGTDPAPFFWKYYVPLISTIMKENFK